VITAVDTNVLLDLVDEDPQYADESEGALAAAALVGAVVISEPVYAELAGRFPEPMGLDRFLDETGVRLLPASRETLMLVGATWCDYSRRRPRTVACPSCGATQEIVCGSCGTGVLPRQHIVADFMIGAHATMQADRLLTRDRGYYGTYFPQLILG
jgi:predicted nucleic acid-binding protein